MADAALDPREQIARIGRMILESQKFVAEHDKRAAEARTLDRDRRIAPWQIAVLLIGSVTGFIGGIGGIVAALRAIGAL